MLYRLVFVVVLAGCGEALPRHSLIAEPTNTSPEIRDACAFTEQKCTRCHTIGRVLSWEARTRQQWEPLVTRMRQMASSGISRSDAEVVLRCLSERDTPQRHAVMPQPGDR
jgi:hypothetical protein